MAREGTFDESGSRFGASHFEGAATVRLEIRAVPPAALHVGQN